MNGDAKADRSVECSVGLADSTLRAYRKEGDALVVTIEAWNAASIEVRFSGVIAIKDLDCGDIADLVERTTGGDLLAEAIDRYFDVVPIRVPHQQFDFVSSDGIARLQVVAEHVETRVSTAK